VDLEARLQSRYTELLEKRIAQLELVIDATEKEVTKLRATKESDGILTTSKAESQIQDDADVAKSSTEGGKAETKTASSWSLSIYVTSS
jgi:hypothetical protein